MLKFGREDSGTLCLELECMHAVDDPAVGNACAKTVLVEKRSGVLV